ncbi:Uu.00g104280.m01.CDS01 [Anthostomella pinea]|uniref:Uu.00g104280.m01.CDS01 n=1 Tax=Anthostomella pinea TaxID=933095 RepID=A0AAI8VE77_9PEZI|nr:Uu.00g104280.m01.CDS01 [Anthostomella pinea]
MPRKPADLVQVTKPDSPGYSRLTSLYSDLMVSPPAARSQAGSDLDGQVGIGSTTGRRGGADDNERNGWPAQPDDGRTGAAEPTSQSLWILIFKGYPRDIQSARVTELYIVFNEDESMNLTIQIQGQHPSFSVKELWNQPAPRARPHFHRRLAVSTLPTSSELDMSLRNAILATRVNNIDADWSCQSWVGDVLTVLQDANMITVEEGDNALDGMVNYISRAPWR